MADNRDDFIIAIRYALLKKGAKQKFSLIFLISFSILTIVVDKTSYPIINSTRAALNDFVYGVAVITSGPGKFLSYLNQTRKKHYKIINQNKILQNEIETLKKNNYVSLFLRTENKSLKRVLSMVDERSNQEEVPVVAKVVLDQESPYLKSLLINKGKKFGIIKGMTVFSNNYLIGTIIESNYLTSRVLLITDLNSRIPVILQDTGINAILIGGGKERVLTLEYLPESFTSAPNKIIFTSGKDGFLKAGLPIARTYLDKKNQLKIKSLADPRQALIVYVSKK